jgi:hypothetical protein
MTLTEAAASWPASRSLPARAAIAARVPSA